MERQRSKPKILNDLFIKRNLSANVMNNTRKKEKKPAEKFFPMIKENYQDPNMFNNLPNSKPNNLQKFLYLNKKYIESNSIVKKIPNTRVISSAEPLSLKLNKLSLNNNKLNNFFYNFKKESVIVGNAFDKKKRRNSEFEMLRGLLLNA